MAAKRKQIVQPQPVQTAQPVSAMSLLMQQVVVEVTEREYTAKQKLQFAIDDLEWSLVCSDWDSAAKFLKNLKQLIKDLP